MGFLSEPPAVPACSSQDSNLALGALTRAGSSALKLDGASLCRDRWTVFPGPGVILQPYCAPR